MVIIWKSAVLYYFHRILVEKPLVRSYLLFVMLLEQVKNLSN